MAQGAVPQYCSSCTATKLLNMLFHKLAQVALPKNKMAQHALPKNGSALLPQDGSRFTSTKSLNMPFHEMAEGAFSQKGSRCTST